MHALGSPCGVSARPCILNLERHARAACAVSAAPSLCPRDRALAVTIGSARRRGTRGSGRAAAPHCAKPTAAVVTHSLGLALQEFVEAVVRCARYMYVPLPGQPEELAIWSQVENFLANEVRPRARHTHAHSHTRAHTHTHN